MIVLVTLCCLISFSYCAVMYRKGRMWINPISFVLIYYALNYPVRAGLVLAFPEVYNQMNLDDQDVFFALIYSTLYITIFFGAYQVLLKTLRVEFSCRPLAQCHLDMRLFIVSAVVVLLVGMMIQGYEMTEGRSFSLGQDIEELQRPLWINAIGIFYTLKWFVLCLGVLVSIRTGSIVALVASALIVVLIVSEGILSTGKGLIVSLFLAFIFVDSYVTGRTMRLPVILVGAALLVLFASYSYYSRSVVGFGVESDGGFREILKFISSGEVMDSTVERLEGMLDRGTYYLDGLALLMRNGPLVDPGPYVLGSTVELLNLIPRATGLVGEQYSFDRHVTESVWGSWVFSQNFIGRIGESFFVLEYLGLIYAVINAAVFALVARTWRKASESLAGIALYFAVLTSWLQQDASLFYQIKVLVYVLVAYYLVKSMAHFTNFHAAAVARQSR